MKAALICTFWSLSSCATSAFHTPQWAYSGTSQASTTTVEQYLAQHVAKYDGMLGDLEVGKHVLELPIIGAAVIGTTGVALGAGKSLAIISAGVGGLGAASSTYVGPRQRLTLVAQARAAVVCIRREYIDQTELAVSADVLRVQDASTGQLIESANYSALGTAATQTTGAGRIAVAAAESVASKLKVHLAGLGQAPDYGAIVRDIQAKASAAQANRLAALAKRGQALPEHVISFLSEYSVRIAQCETKMP